MLCGIGGMAVWPYVLRATALASVSPFMQGFALGSASHVSVSAALTTAGLFLAADAACLSFFLMGVTRCVLLQIRPFRDLLCLAAEGDPELWGPRGGG